MPTIDLEQVCVDLERIYEYIDAEEYEAAQSELRYVCEQLGYPIHGEI